MDSAKKAVISLSEEFVISSYSILTAAEDEYLLLAL